MSLNYYCSLVPSPNPWEYQWKTKGSATERRYDESAQFLVMLWLSIKWISLFWTASIDASVVGAAAPQTSERYSNPGCIWASYNATTSELNSQLPSSSHYKIYNMTISNEIARSKKSERILAPKSAMISRSRWLSLIQHAHSVSGTGLLNERLASSMLSFAKLWDGIVCCDKRIVNMD